MYDPIDLSVKTKRVVTEGSLKKYYRFRPTRFYGGIATADTVGCNLRCRFCWSGNSVWNAQNTGEMYAPKEVARKLNDMAESNGYHQLRISGGEPTIGKQHLIEVLQKIDSEKMFILETNGILLGYDQNYVNELLPFENLHVRVCLKGCNEKEFSWLTGADTGYGYQLQALKNLRDAGMRFHIALVSIQGNSLELYDRLDEMGLRGISVELEEITLYPQVKKRLKDEGMLDYFLTR
jgi:uncharacterized Fe-S cluster-containing radical SAM superfamily protein